MPAEGAIEYAYGRQYRFVKPNNTEPGTYRLSTPETGTGGGPGVEGGGGSVAHDIDGNIPIKAVTIAGNPMRTTISLDITSLTSRV